jgi:hypothetical protein
MPMVKKTNELVHRKSSFFCLRVALSKFSKTMAQPAPPVGNPPPPGAGAIPLPAFMAPQGGGDVENLVTALYGQDIGRLRELSVNDMTLIASLYGTQEPQGTTQVMAHAIGVQSGPCSFLTILPTTPGNDPIVEVITGLRQYVRPATDGLAAVNDPLNNRTFALFGDSFQPQLPVIRLEPSNGFVAAGQPSNMAVPTDASLTAYFQQHPDHILAPRRTGVTVNEEVRRVLYLPTAWTPAFIGGLSPREAWTRALELQALMEAPHRALFDPIVTWTRAACAKIGGASAEANQSQLCTPWRQVRMDQRFIQWANTAVRSFFPGTTFGTTNPPPGATNFGAITQAMTQSLTTGLSGLVQGISALAPVQPTTQSSSTWSPMQQEAILKACGLSHGTAWNHPNRPGIWASFESEGKTAPNIQQVMRQALVRMNSGNQQMTGLEVMPTITPEVAKDIQRCAFGGEQALSGETCDRGLLPIAVQPRTMVDQIAAEADEEEYGELSFRTTSDVKTRRDKAQRFRRSPKNYLGVMASLQAYDMVLETLYTSDCPLLMQLRLVRRWLQHGRNYFEPTLSPRDCASIMWKISVQAKDYFDAPYDDLGRVQQPGLHMLVAEIKNHQIGVPMTMPPTIISTDMAHMNKDSRQIWSMGNEDTFGEQVVNRRYNKVPTQIQSMLADIKRRQPGISIQQICSAAPGGLSTGQLILKPGQCIDFMALGSCKSTRCTYRHDGSSEAEPARIKNFLEKLQPGVDAMKKRKRE